MDLDDPIALALAIDEALRGRGVPHALYGGLLLAAYGEPRQTRDVDIAVARADVASVVRLLEAELGLRTIPAFDRRTFGGLLISRITLLEGDELNTQGLVEPRDPAYAERARWDARSSHRSGIARSTYSRPRTSCSSSSSPRATATWQTPSRSRRASAPTSSGS